MNTIIDINSDLGEWHPETGLNNDLAIIPFLTSCNICCGFHSSSPELIQNTIRNAIAHDLKIGAHPSYNDRENFGRKPITQDIPSLLSDILYQISALKGMVEYYDNNLYHVKPHGALYHQIHNDKKLGIAFVKLVKDIDPHLKIMGIADSELKSICKQEGVKFINEVFADRRYKNKTSLVSRSEENAVIENEKEFIKHISLLTKGQVLDSANKLHNISVDSICIHSDTKNAETKAKLLFDFLNSKIPKS